MQTVAQCGTVVLREAGIEFTGQGVEFLSEQAAQRGDAVAVAQAAARGGIIEQRRPRVRGDRFGDPARCNRVIAQRALQSGEVDRLGDDPGEPLFTQRASESGVGIGRRRERRGVLRRGARVGSQPPQHFRPIERRHPYIEQQQFVALCAGAA